MIAKVLSNRLLKVIQKVISQKQFAFVGWRNINMLVGVLVVNEVIHEAKAKNKLCLIFKIDL